MYALLCSAFTHYGSDDADKEACGKGKVRNNGSFLLTVKAELWNTIFAQLVLSIEHDPKVVPLL